MFYLLASVCIASLAAQAQSRALALPQEGGVGITRECVAGPSPKKSLLIAPEFEDQFDTTGKDRNKCPPAVWNVDIPNGDDFSLGVHFYLNASCHQTPVPRLLRSGIPPEDSANISDVAGLFGDIVGGLPADRGQSVKVAAQKVLDTLTKSVSKVFDLPSSPDVIDTLNDKADIGGKLGFPIVASPSYGGGVAYAIQVSGEVPVVGQPSLESTAAAMALFVQKAVKGILDYIQKNSKLEALDALTLGVTLAALQNAVSFESAGIKKGKPDAKDVMKGYALLVSGGKLTTTPFAKFAVGLQDADTIASKGYLGEPICDRAE